MLIAQSLLPAERMATELSDVDAETTKMEAHVGWRRGLWRGLVA